MKKLLILGGSNAQVPAIIQAKKLGFYTITCDYLPDNPGHAYSDLYVNISTIDYKKVLEFAEREKIDGIIAYASDPSAPSAAYVSEKMGLPGASWKSTRIFCEKDLFRKFQKENVFLFPWFFCIQDENELDNITEKIKYPCVVKPVDLSGSKGVSTIFDYKDLKLAVKEALLLSRCKRVIIEEYIESPYCQLHGDGVVVDGQLRFIELGDQRFKDCVPIGSSFPSQIDPEIMEKVIETVKRHIKASGFYMGGINVEVRVGKNNEIYVIEIGPRTGGNYIPQLMELATGFDEMTAALKLAMGEECAFFPPDNINYCFQYIVGSDQDGVFQELYIDEYILKKVVDKYIHKRKGDYLADYKNSNGVVGVILLKFSNRIEMECDIKNIKEHIKVIVKEETDEE